ncbi:DUF1657 domain-containing protein [Phosphitispora fastidiosa]|uniref:DUF1657 domain-containing protein n=1 Tax=Phosphitispora fastidiosa TaxID=2837202 RepID=UPI001E5899D3|nr:DUF1657 domain-containing protein [Phosphitispora fastidiosa]MBU7007099.1 hypothetical protein [Phosphitispora fastidiosa]
MTVGDKIHQTLASLEGAAANLKTFALETNDQNAKQMFNDLSGQVETISNSLKGRVNYVEQQEPQYKIQQQKQQ